MRNLLIVVCAFVSTAAVGLDTRAAVNVGDKPTIKLKTIENKVLSSKDMAGKIVVLEFWATWCGPCVQQVPHLRELNNKYIKQGVRLVSISRDDSRGPVIPFIRQNGMNWTHAIDKEQPQELAPMFGVSGIPHAFIISPEGEVLWRGHPAQIDKPLEEAVKNHPPTPSAADRRDDALGAIEKAVELIDKKEDYAGAYEALADIPDESFEDSKVKPRFKALAMRFKPVGRRAEPLAKFYEENPKAKERLAKLGAQVEATPAGKPLPDAKPDAAKQASPEGRAP